MIEESTIETTIVAEVVAATDRSRYVNADRSITRQPMSDGFRYLGFDVNGEECERFLGDAFETHIPSKNQIVYRADGREVIVNVGDVLSARSEASEEDSQPESDTARRVQLVNSTQSPV